eukprot:11227396-Lingulodinium_polyedra.AAC.1
MASSSPSLVVSSSSETQATQAVAPALALSSSPGETASSMSTDPAFEAALLAHGAVRAEQATVTAGGARSPLGVMAGEPWDLDAAAGSATADERRIHEGTASAT